MMSDLSSSEASGVHRGNIDYSPRHGRCAGVTVRGYRSGVQRANGGRDERRRKGTEAGRDCGDTDSQVLISRPRICRALSCSSQIFQGRRRHSTPSGYVGYEEETRMSPIAIAM
jgi:hypothetical protein